jgi:hypothetical protein
MIGNLDGAIKALLERELPALLGGASPPVQALITSELFGLDAKSVDEITSAPRPDDRTDNLPFDPAQPIGPYMLTQSPAPGPKRVYLTSALRDRIALRESEVQWDETESRRLTLNLRPDRSLQGLNGLQVLYSVVAVFTRLKLNQDFSLQLQASDAVNLKQAEALAVAVLTLNRQQLLDGGHESYQGGNYGAQVEVKSFQLLKGTSPAANTRLLNFRAEIELKATRALGADEGKPIQRIRTAGRPLAPNRPVDIQIDVEA